jgi:hypothetical protein
MSVTNCHVSEGRLEESEMLCLGGMHVYFLFQHRNVIIYCLVFKLDLFVRSYCQTQLYNS